MKSIVAVSYDNSRRLIINLSKNRRGERKKKKGILLSLTLMALLVVFISVSFAESTFTISGVTEATDEELENARQAILQEKKNRLHIEFAIVPGEISVKKGGSQKLETEAVNLPDGVKPDTYTWTSSDESIAKVEKTGTVKGVGNGEAIVTCVCVLSDGTEVSANCLVKVIVPVQSVKTAASKVTLQMEQSQKLEFAVQPADATIQQLTYSSSDPSVVTVDENGLIKAVGGGKATITATTTDGTDKTAKAEIFVPSLAGGSSLSIGALNADYNGIIRPTEYTFSYYGKGELSVKSSSSKLFKCELGERNGNEVIIKVTPKRAGNGTMTITDSNDSSSKLVVNVSIPSSAV